MQAIFYETGLNLHLRCDIKFERCVQL